MSSSHLAGSVHSEASEWDELQARSLAFAEIDGPNDHLKVKPKPKSTSYRCKQIAILVVLAICVFIVYKEENFLTSLIMDTEAEYEVNTKDEVDEVKTDDGAQEIDRVGELKARVLQSKVEFEKLLDEDYGTYKDIVFNKESILKSFQSPSQVSMERLQRRIMIKILEAQCFIYDSSCNEGKSVDFNWAVGGHSAAAGHGNLFNQTYTFTLEESVKPIFESLGITFFGKNYAMGGMKSAPESALCMSSLYGPDIDVLSWDFGMTDGSRDGNLYNTWAQRAGAHPTQPIIISFGSTAAIGIHKEVEKNGMAAFDAVFVSERSEENASKKLPNSDSDDININDLPRGVKFYRCGDSVEKNDPCGDRDIKFDTKKSCERVNGQVSWHNGWKDHMLKGRIIAAFLVENIMTVLEKFEDETQQDQYNNGNEDNLDIKKPAWSKEYLDYLYTLEAADKALFMSSSTPTVAQFSGPLQDHHDIFLRSKIFCRYAYVPSYSRYNRLFTEVTETLDYLGGGRTTYTHEGEDYNHRRAPSPDSDTPLSLVYNYANEHQVCAEADIDFKDYFNIRSQDKWVTTVVPNDSENNAFSDGDDWKQRIGLITLCERFFAFGRFPPSFISLEDMFKSGDKEAMMIVNDVQVTNVTKIGTINSYCYVLHHDGDYVFPPSETHGPGRYEMKVRIPQNGKELFVSSIIVV